MGRPSKSERLCACGCGDTLTGTARQRYTDNAHRQRAHRQREGRRMATRRVSVAAAVAARGRGHLLSLLAAAAASTKDEGSPDQVVALLEAALAEARRSADPDQLVQLLDAAMVEARRRPGSVMLRAAGRLVALDAGELARLVELLRADQATATNEA